MTNSPVDKLAPVWDDNDTVTTDLPGAKDSNQMEVTAPAQEKREFRILTAEERNDLRKRVLAGEDLTLEEARSVYETVRLGGAAALIAADGTGKKKRSKKPGMSDDELSSSLDDALKEVE